MATITGGPRCPGSDSNGVVYVVAKAPVAGQAKTRLSPPLTPEDAAQLAGAFLLDTLVSVVDAGLTPRLICRNADDRVLLAQVAGSDVRADVQPGTGLGDALESAFQHGVDGGFAAVAVLGADTPTLPASILREGFVALARGAADVTLGPSEDGGYYFLAARALHPTLFREMEWSTDRVAAETLRRSAAAGLRVHLLPRWYDVDDAASLDRLQTHLRRLPDAVARYTRSALGAIAAGLVPA
jgi:rSAM/selenodomain-associated transferase 1